MLKKILLLFFFLALPVACFAHASPVESVPHSGAQLQEFPKEVTIRFSERLERGSSRIKVTDTKDGSVTLGEAKVSADNPYILSVPLSQAEEGVYIASWSVVSSDDGHFTKGSFAFSVGSSTASLSAADSVIVQITGYGEATGMFVEFVGNSVLWGVLLMMLILRPLLKNEKNDTYQVAIKKIFSYLTYGAIIIGGVGGVAQIILKTSELSGLHESSFAEALSMYLATTSGSSTLWRMAAFALCAVVFTLFRRALFSSSKFTAGEVLMFGCLLVFAYFRAVVSHASANPFHPEFSVFVNMLHLIEKDLWPGLLTCLIALFFVIELRSRFLQHVIRQTCAFLTLNLAALSLTASYIIWLHLKDFSNISATLWGENFLRLLAPAIVLVSIHGFHVLSLRYRPRLFAWLFSYSITAEAIAAFLVVYFSSLIIITSPPLHNPEPKEFIASDQGVVIELRKSPYEDSQALLIALGGEPIVLIGEGEGGLQVSLTKRFHGGYVFPLSLLENKDEYVQIIVPQEGGYDARAPFNIARDDFKVPEGHGRTFDGFSIITVSIAFAVFAFALYLRRVGREHGLPEHLSYSLTGAITGIVAALVAVYFLTNTFVALFGNDFKRQCLADSNMWHLMIPMKAGAPVSQTPQEGCMLMNGAYHFSDKREYDYLRALPPAIVNLAHVPERSVAGIPTTLSLTFTEEDGSPAKMSVIHDKLVHLIIISADMTEFIHVHPEDVVTEGDSVEKSHFEISHTFPKAGEYLVAVDYLHGLTPESRQFRVQVMGTPLQIEKSELFLSPQKTHGLDVQLNYSQPFAEELATLRFVVDKDGVPVTDLEPYLSAAMHLAIVKNDLSEFIHTHGEVHPPGYVPPKTLVMNHNHTPPPPRFGPNIEAHAIFPTPGVYTVFGEFSHKGEIVQSRFTVRVED